VESTSRNNKSLGFEYDNNGKLIHANPPASGSTVSYDYDARSTLTQETDPDRGTSEYEFNSLGELIGFETANGDKDSIIYNHIGRDSLRIRDNGQTTYLYYTSGNGIGKLKEISSPAGYKKYSYDIYGNVIRECDSISTSEYFPYSYEYNEYGKLSKMTYPGGFAVKYEYSTGTGHLQYIKKADDNSIIWQCNSVNENGNITQYSLSVGSITVYKSFDNNGYLTQIQTDAGATTKQWFRYSFDATTGDLSWRRDSLRNITESFSYDVFDQLKWSKVTGQDSLKMNYDDIGNITFKSDVGTYYYNSTRIHAVDSISGSQYPGRQNIEYNFFNKPVYIADDEDSLNYIYNVLDDRIKATLYGTGGLVRTTWYAGLYEKTLENSITKHYYYINGPDGPIGLAIQNGSGTPELYYLCKDHLGSITGIMNSSGNLVEKYNYDAWGRRRNPDDWSYDSIPAVTYTHHGFTGHEHLDMFNLINMNGRVYDSEIARFVSPDPIIQDPYNILSYNRYAYCLNNPLKYTDPSGYSSKRLWEEELLRMESYGQNTQFFNNYPNNWSEYQSYFSRSHYGNTTYQYNWETGKYTDKLGRKVSYSEVFVNYIVPNSLITLSESVAQDYLRLLQESHITGSTSLIDPRSTLTAGPGGDLHSAPLRPFWTAVKQLWDLKIIGGSMPDNISLDLNLGSVLGIGESVTFSVNILTRGDAGFYLTRTEQLRGGAEVDWGLNINMGYYTGNPLDINKSSLLGPVRSVSGGWIYGGNISAGYSNNNFGRPSWINVGIGVGLTGGGSYGWGKTYGSWTKY